MIACCVRGAAGRLAAALTYQGDESRTAKIARVRFTTVRPVSQSYATLRLVGETCTNYPWNTAQ